MHFAIPRFLWQNAMSCGFPGIYSWLYHIGFGTMNDVSNVFLYWLDGNLAAGWDTSEFIVTWMKNTRIANCNCKFARSFSSQTNECRLRYRLWLIVLTFVPFISDTRTLGRIYAKREEKKNRLWKEGMVFLWFTFICYKIGMVLYERILQSSWMCQVFIATTSDSIPHWIYCQHKGRLLVFLRKKMCR